MNLLRFNIPRCVYASAKARKHPSPTYGTGSTRPTQPRPGKLHSRAFAASAYDPSMTGCRPELLTVSTPHRDRTGGGHLGAVEQTGGDAI
jgi:hypothetical protein